MNSSTKTLRLAGMTLATTNMLQMVKFYEHLLEVEFDKVEMYGTRLYKATFNELELLFCPAELAQNTATQNRHQLDFEVEDLDDLTEQLKQLGGEFMGEKQQDGSFIQIGMKDPDSNSLVLKQRL